jgi:predicted metalloenzyme YecM
MYCKKLSELSDLLSEITIGGRKVSTYKLHEAYKWKGREIPCVELPQPKASSFYSKGLEHVEFVIDKDFATFMGEHPNLEWDTSGSGKSSNPDIALKFKTENKNISVKFHHKPLERVIEEEQKEGITEVV